MARYPAFGPVEPLVLDVFGRGPVLPVAHDRHELFNRLDVAKDGRVTDLAYNTSDELGAAVAFNSALSIPYAVDGIEKSLGE
jgi:hypothetical protein